MLPLAVRPVRSLWLLFACLLLLPLGAAAGDRPDVFAHHRTYVSHDSGARQLFSRPAARVMPNTAEDAEDDDSDASAIDGSALLVLGAMRLEGAPPSVVIAHFDAAIAGPRSPSATLPFVPRPPPARASS